jgi:hypothetical protein
MAAGCILTQKPGAKIVFFMVISWTTLGGQDMDHSVRPHKQVNSGWRTHGDPEPVCEGKARVMYGEETVLFSTKRRLSAKIMLSV